jgi:hypothetical protein
MARTRAVEAAEVIPAPPPFPAITAKILELLERYRAEVEALRGRLPAETQPSIDQLLAIANELIQAGDMANIRAALVEALAAIVAGSGPVEHDPVHHA